MSKVITPDIEDTQRYEEYENLLIQKDQLLKEAASYQIRYTQEFGEQICANFELKLQCIKVKKSIGYCRRRMNRGLAVDVSKMETEIEQEMKVYYSQLDQLYVEYDHARKATEVGHYDSMLSKRLYRRLAKLLHPDINAMTEQNEDLTELWNRIVIAYEQSDVDALEELEVLTKRKLEELGVEGIEKDYSDLEERIERVESQINNLLTTEPYSYKELLENAEKREAFRETLRAEYEDFENYLGTLKRALEEMLRGEASKIIWLTN